MNRYTSGDEIWVIERDYSEPYGIVGVTYLATVGEFVITCPQFYGLDTLEEVMEQYVEETQGNSCLDMSVYPLADCFVTREEAEAELRRQIVI